MFLRHFGLVHRGHQHRQLRQRLRRHRSVLAQEHEDGPQLLHRDFGLFRLFPLHRILAGQPLGNAVPAMAFWSGDSNALQPCLDGTTNANFSVFVGNHGYWMG